MYSKFLSFISSFFARFLRVFLHSPKNAHPITNYDYQRENDRNLDGFTMDTLNSTDIEKMAIYYCEHHRIDQTEMDIEDWQIICNVTMISAMATEINNYEDVADLD